MNKLKRNGLSKQPCRITAITTSDKTCLAIWEYSFLFSIFQTNKISSKHFSKNYEVLVLLKECCDL